MTDNPDGYMTWDHLATEINFLEIARQEEQRTLICHKDDVARYQTSADRNGLADILTIRPSPACPRGTAYLIDENARKAAEAEFAQSFVRRPRWHGGAL